MSVVPEIIDPLRVLKCCTCFALFTLGPLVPEIIDPLRVLKFFGDAAKHLAIFVFQRSSTR